jgi:hypothetical protein
MHTQRFNAALRATVLLLALAAALPLTGCANKSIVGTWTTGGPPWMSIQDTFRDDGTESINVAGDIAPGQHLNMLVNGKYKYSDGMLTRNSMTTTIAGATTPLPADSAEQVFAVTLEGKTLKMPTEKAVPVPGIVPSARPGVPLVYKLRE